MAGVAGIVLASGMSGRFGHANKLLVRLGGRPVVRRTVEAYTQGGLSPVVVVVGYEAELVREALSGLPVTFVENNRYREGQSWALRRGVGAMPADVDAAIIGVADQPYLSGDVIRRLAERYGQTGSALIVPRYAGARGNPVLFGRALFPELLAVSGDQGGRPVLEAHRNEIVWLDLAEARARLDIDTREDYESLRDQET